MVSTIGFPLVGGPAGTMEGGRQAEVAKVGGGRPGWYILFCSGGGGGGGGGGSGEGRERMHSGRSWQACRVGCSAC